MVLNELKKIIYVIFVLKDMKELNCDNIAVNKTLGRSSPPCICKIRRIEWNEPLCDFRVKKYTIVM